MAQNVYKSDYTEDVLSYVRDGMPVYDAEDKKVGKVKYVQMGDGSADALAQPTDFYNLPPETQSRLARHGYIQIDCGFFARDRVATPDQIDELNDDGLRLRVMGDDLLAI